MVLSNIREDFSYKKVLLIEDNEQHKKIVSRLLRENTDIDLVTCDTLERGTRYIQENEVSLVLLDLTLDDSRGLVTFKKLNLDFGATPIIILSALGDKDLAKQLVQEGAQDFLCKSEVSRETLVRAIYSAIERKRIEQHLIKENAIKESLTYISRKSLTSTNYEKFLKFICNRIRIDLSADLVVFYKYNSIENRFVASNIAGSDFSRIEGESFKNIDSCEIPFISSGIKYGCNEVIRGRGGTTLYGVLGVYDVKNELTKEEKLFVKSVSNILASSIQRCQLENSLREKISQLNDAHRNKDEFLSVLSHELRTPLSVITNSLDLIERHPEDYRKVDELLTVIKRNVRQEIKLVDDILDTSRIITGCMKITKSKFSLRNLVQEVIESVSFSASSKDIFIELGELSDPIYMLGDKDRIRQVIWNLLSNSIKFTENGGSVFVDLLVENSNLKVVVKDTGVGISKEKIPLVFNKFWQSDSTKARRNMGLGLGMSISKYIIEAHGGTLSCHSEGLGKGTTFFMTFPRKGVNSSIDLNLSGHKASRVQKTVVPSHWVDGDKMSLKGFRIMVIDDNVDGLNIYKYCLESEDALVSEFSDAESALEDFKRSREKFDAIVSDVGLPGMDGFEFIKCIRNIENQNMMKTRIPAAALTAFARKSDEDQALASGFDVFIKKPIQTDVLVSKIKKLIHNQS